MATIIDLKQQQPKRTYDDALIEQKGCAICGKPFPEGTQVTLSLDTGDMTHPDCDRRQRTASNASLRFDIEAEQSVLGAVLCGRLTVAWLRYDQFYDPLHQAIYEVMERLIRQGRDYTAESIRAELRDNEMLRELGPEYLFDLMRNAPRGRSIIPEARRIERCWRNRQLEGGKDS